MSFENIVFPDLSAQKGKSGLYNNPMFDYAGEFMPRDIKKLLDWCEHIYYNTPIIASAIKKYINYPITEFNYLSSQPMVREATQKFLMDTLKIKSHLLLIGVDYFVYGNAFRSLSLNGVKYFNCKKPGCTHNLPENKLLASEVKFELKNKEILFFCPSCKSMVPGKLTETSIHSPENLKLITWSPHRVEIKYNPVTNDAFYAYNLESIKSDLNFNDRDIFLSTPLPIIKASLNNKFYGFGSKFFHLKEPTLSGIHLGWGVSPLTAIIKTYIYLCVLRKSNEAIAMEHVVPKNIVFPQATTTDPSIATDMGQWQTEITKALSKWRTDPNYVMTAPYPTGIVNLGSQGKGLMVTQEIRQAQEDMLFALDIHPDLVFNSTNLNNSPLALRMLESNLESFISQLTTYVNWIIDTTNDEMKTNYCNVKFAPFRLSDDMMKQQLLVNAFRQDVSKGTLLTALNVDPEAEAKKIKAEQIEDFKRQKELDKTLKGMEQSVMQQAENQAEIASAETDIPEQVKQTLITQAHEIAQQILQTPGTQRQPMWKSLRAQDPFLYMLVKASVDELDNAARNETYAQTKAQAQQAAQETQQPAPQGGPNGQ